MHYLCPPYLLIVFVQQNSDASVLDFLAIKFMAWSNCSHDARNSPESQSSHLFQIYIACTAIVINSTNYKCGLGSILYSSRFKKCFVANYCIPFLCSLQAATLQTTFSCFGTSFPFASLSVRAAPFTIKVEIVALFRLLDAKFLAEIKLEDFLSNFLMKHSADGPWQPCVNAMRS